MLKTTTVGRSSRICNGIHVKPKWANVNGSSIARERLHSVSALR